MKWLSVLIATSFVCLAADVAVVEEIVAKVNGDIITRGELDQKRKLLEEELKQQGTTQLTLQQAVADREKDILRNRIDELVLIQKGKDLNINVDSEWSKYQADLQRQIKVADPEKFQAYVKEQTGMPYEDFKQQTKDTMMTQHVIRQEVGGKMNVSHEDIQKYYDAHKQDFVRKEQIYLREILVSTEGKDAAGATAAEKKAKDLVARARKGERFAELARDNSDAMTAQNYGDLGTPYKKGDLNKLLEDQVWEKPKGYVTDPIKIDNGFEILRVEEHQKAGQADVSEVENEITDKLLSPKMQPKVREYLTKLRQDAFLEIKAGYVDSGAAPGKDTSWQDPAQLKPETTTKREVANRTKHKKLLWAIPIPGTKTAETSSSK
jgi:parvulin-like peptidyl-prolyl isomerase